MFAFSALEADLVSVASTAFRSAISKMTELPGSAGLPYLSLHLIA